MARTVSVKLLAEVSGYVAGVRTAARSTKDFVSSLDAAAKQGRLDAVADQAGRMGLALVGAFGIAVGAAAKFDKEMSEVAAVSNATGAELEQLRKAALAAGKDTAFSASEAAKAEGELAKAGLSTADILGGALRGSLDLAAAGSLDLAQAADISAKAMNTFGLKGRDVGHIADVLAAAANKSATDVHEMGEALKMGGLAANAAGLSLEETAGTLAAFADRALVGSDAGTSLKTMLQMLAAPTGKAKELMEKLGISAYDASGRFIGTVKLAGQLERALGDLTQQQRNAALATIFGADAMRAANVLLALGESGVRDYVAAVNDQGAAAEVAAKKMDNLAGDIEKLKGSLETLAIESGSGANSGLRQLVQLADGLVAAFSALPGPVQSTIVMLTGVAGAALLAFAAFVKMRRASAQALAELRAMGPAGATAAAGLERTARAARLAGAAFVALEVANVIISELRDSAVDVDKLTASLEELGKTGKRTGELARVFGENADDVKAAGQQFRMAADGWVQDMGRITERIPVIGSFGRAFNQAFGKPTFLQAQENVRALDMQLAEFAATTEDVSVAQAAYHHLLVSSGLSAEEFAKIMPKSNAALREAWQNAEKAGKAQGQAGEAMQKAGQDAEDAAKKVEELKKAYDALFGATMGADRASIAYKEGLVALQKELETGKRTLDTNTKAGRDNVSAVLDQIDKINDLRQANIDNGMAVEDANRIYDGQIGQLRKTLLQLGFNKKEVDALIGKYRNIPKSVYTEARFNTSQATKGYNTVKSQIRDLNGRVVTINVRYNSQGVAVGGGERARGGGTKVAFRWGGITEHAQEGLLRDASIFTTASPARFAFAEPGTGGEAFIPRNGDMARSRAIWDYVGRNWLGMQQSAAPVNVKVFIGDRELTDMVRVEISEHDRMVRRRVLAGSTR
ncbi:MAG TPA: phage tail tape measure protein [Trebonia sp.]